MARDLFEPDNLASNARAWGGRGLHAGLNTLGDFRKFILRGNVVDLAVGVVIGAAFNNVVQSFVKDIITPLIGTAGVKNFNSLKVPLLNGNDLLVGDLLNVILSFIIIAAVVYFFVVKPINALEDRYNSLRPKPAETPKTRECPFCLTTVPLKATRCAACTAQLPPADAPQAVVQS